MQNDKKMRQSHLILFNASIMWASRVLLLAPQLILVPYLIGTIGETGYGIYALVWSLMMSIEFLQRSLQSGVVKYSAGFIANGEMEEVNKLVSTSFVFSLFLAILVCIGTLVSLALYSGPAEMATIFIVIAIMVLFIFPLTPYVAVIQSRQYYYVNALAETASKYVGLLAIMIWFHMIEPSVEALIIIMAVMLFFARLVQVPVAYYLIPGLSNRLSLFNGRSFRLISAFGAATILASLCLAVNTSGIRWLMNTLASTNFITHLAIMLMPSLLLTQIISAATIVVMPATSAYEATQNQRMLQELLIRGMRYTLILSLAGLMVAGLLMKNVLSLWVGSEYEFLAPYALVLFTSVSFMLSTSVAHHMLKGLEKLRAVILIYFFGLVVVPIVSILIIFNIWHDPYVSVTFGLAAGHLLCGGLQIWFCTRVVHADIWQVFMRAYAQPLIVASVVCGVFFVIAAYVGIEGLIAQIFVSLLISLAFFGGCYALIFNSAERQQLQEIVQVIKNKITLNSKEMPEAR